ncbi:molybdopterin-containing oxidoreductase family protein, partial [Trichloromonas sp.]|uniref:molybdopterin-containing oxidoreductase family protein n=1 Tax=Trichloromonas sp. TaxID=3069249 RepID=UPI003D815B90
RISHDPLDYLNSRSLLLWGRNPVVTGPTLARIAADLRRRGDTVVLIDPVASESRPLADLHIQPKPGSDAWLAMAAAKLILRQGKEDRDFIADCSEGFTGYQQILDGFSLDELCRRCDVPQQQVAALADLLTENRPAAITLGWGMHRYEYAHLALRSIDALGAIAGCIGVSGGGVSQGFDEYAPFDMALAGDHWHPGRRRLLMPRLGADLLAARDPKIEMIFVTAGNPVAMAPNTALVRQAFGQTPFVVVAGLFLDDTARTADLILPTTTFLEEDDFVGSYGHSYVGPVNRAVAPPGDCRSDFDIFCALAQRFDFADEFRRTRDQWQQRLLAPVLAQGLDLEALRRGPQRLPDVPAVPYRDRRFPTPSGKFRFLQTFDAPAAMPDSTHPLHLLSTAPPQWLCSETTPAAQQQPAELRLHPETAKAAGLAGGDLAWVENERGRVAGRVRLAAAERRDTLVFPRGKWLASGSSVNQLTCDAVSKVGNGASYYDTRVRIYPVNEDIS